MIFSAARPCFLDKHGSNLCKNSIMVDISLAFFLVNKMNEFSDVYLADTDMLIFGMVLYGLFINNAPSDMSPAINRNLRNVFFEGNYKPYNHLGADGV